MSERRMSEGEQGVPLVKEDEKGVELGELAGRIAGAVMEWEAGHERWPWPEKKREEMVKVIEGALDEALPEWKG